MIRRIALCLTTLTLAISLHAYAEDNAGSRVVTVPTTLSGTWSGKAKALSYQNTNNTGTDTGTGTGTSTGTGTGTSSKTKSKPQSASAAVTAVFSQTGTALTMQVTFVTTEKNQPSETFSGALTGVYGNGTFWVIGVTSNANRSQSTIMTGHVTSKAITGIGLLFSGDNDAEISYSLKPQTTAAQTGLDAAHVTSLCGGAPAVTRDNTPVIVTGKATGKIIPLGETSKALPFKSAVTGTVSNSGGTASGTLSFSDSSGTETFTLNGLSYGDTFVIFGPNSGGTEQAVFSLHAGNNTAKGIGIIYGTNSLAEVKVSLKKQ
jgi:hypothetical protein